GLAGGPALARVLDAPHAANGPTLLVRDERAAVAGRPREPERERPELRREVLVDEQQVHGWRCTRKRCRRRVPAPPFAPRPPGLFPPRRAKPGRVAGRGVLHTGVRPREPVRRLECSLYGQAVEQPAG